MKITIKNIETGKEASKVIEGLKNIYGIGETQSDSNSEELNSKLTKALDDVEMANRKLKECKMKHLIAKDEIDTLAGKVAEHTGKFLTAKDEIHALKLELSDKKTTIDDLHDKLDNALYDLTTLETELATKNTIIKALEATNNELVNANGEDELLTLKEELEALKAQKNKLREGCTKDLQALRDTIKKLTTPYDLNNIEVDKKDSDIEEWAKYYSSNTTIRDPHEFKTEFTGLPNSDIKLKTGGISNFVTLDDMIEENRAKNHNDMLYDESVLIDENGEVSEVLGTPIDDFIANREVEEEIIDDDLELDKILNSTPEIEDDKVENDTPKIELSNPTINAIIPKDIFIRGKGEGINAGKVKEVISTFDLSIEGSTPKTSEYKSIYSSISKILNRKTLATIRDRAGADKNNTLAKNKRFGYLKYLEAIKGALTVENNTPKDTEDISDTKIEVNNGLIEEIEAIKSNLKVRVEEAIEKANKPPLLTNREDIFKWTIDKIKTTPKSVKSPLFEDMEVLTNKLMQHMDTKDIKHLYNILCDDDIDREQISDYYSSIKYTSIVNDLIGAIDTPKEDNNSYKYELVESSSNPTISEFQSPLNEQDKNEYVAKANEFLEKYKGQTPTWDFGTLKMEIFDLHISNKLNKKVLVEALRVFVDNKEKANKLDRVNRLASAINTSNYRAIEEFIKYLQTKKDNHK